MPDAVGGAALASATTTGRSMSGRMFGGVEILTAVLLILVAIAIVYEVARRIGVPYPTLLVLGGLGLAFVPGLPRIDLEPELVLLVFLPPLLFAAAVEIADPRSAGEPRPRSSVSRSAWSSSRWSIVAVVAQALVPGLSWAGRVHARCDRRHRPTRWPPRRSSAGSGRRAIIKTLIEGEALFNDATALVAYRAAVAAAVSGGFVLSESLAGFVVAAVGGVAIGAVVGWVAGEILRRLDDPPVEVLISIVIPFAAYLPGRPARAVRACSPRSTAGLVIGSRLGTILSPSSRVLVADAPGR